MAALGVLAVLLLSAAAAPNALAATGSISGTVTGAPSKAGLAEVEACAWETHGGEVFESDDHCVFTTPTGSYEIGSLGEGTYRVLFWPRGQGMNYVPRFYDADGMWPADSVSVGAGQTSGIDAELPQGGSIKGRVTSDVGGVSLAGVMVCANRRYNHLDPPSCAPTNNDGRYLIVGLWTEEYELKFDPDPSGLQYFGEYYDNQIFGNGHPPGSVSVSEGSVTGVDVALRPAAEIRGIVTAAINGAPLSKILVCAAPPLAFLESSFPELSFADDAKCTRTSGSGAYAIKGLEGGQYKVLFSLELRDFIHWFPPLKPEEDGYPTRYWNEKDTLWAAEVLTLNAPTEATGIDARLGPFPPTPIALPSPPPLPTATPWVPKPRCKPGRHLKKVKGKRRCVRPRKHGRR